VGRCHQGVEGIDGRPVWELKLGVAEYLGHLLGPASADFREFPGAYTQDSIRKPFFDGERCTLDHDRVGCPAHVDRFGNGWMDAEVVYEAFMDEHLRPVSGGHARRSGKQPSYIGGLNGPFSEKFLQDLLIERKTILGGIPPWPHLARCRNTWVALHPHHFLLNLNFDSLWLLSLCLSNDVLKN